MMSSVKSSFINFERAIVMPPEIQTNNPNSMFYSKTTTTQ